MSDSSPVTELNLLVGSLFTTQPGEDRERYNEEREWLAELQDLLREEGIEVDLLSRPGVEVWEAGIDQFTDLYRLQLLAAYLERGQDVRDLLTADLDLEEEPDAVLDAIWSDEEQTRFNHLIKHRADSGYYLPVEFDEPLQLVAEGQEDDDDEEGLEDISIGSSIVLQRELVELEQLFQQAGVSLKSTPYRTLQTLREATDQSVRNDLPIVIW